MNKVRWGLLSTANINRRLIPAIRASKQGELVAVASRDHGKARAYAKEWGIAQAFGSYMDMLESGEIEAVYISLPNHLHAEWSVKALKAGVHVLCEKPFALSLDEVDTMIRTSQETGCVLAEAFMYRHHPQTKIARDWVKSGRLGEIFLVQGIFNFSMGSRDNVRLVPEYGGGCLWDVGVYPLSFAQYIFGEAPKRVFGSQWLGETGVDESFAGTLEYSGERVAQIASAFRSPWHTSMEIIGTMGRLTLNRPFVGMENERRMIFHPAKGKPVKVPVPEVELYIGEVEDMHAAILEGTPNYIELNETREHVRTVLALYESAKSGKVVYMD